MNSIWQLYRGQPKQRRLPSVVGHAFAFAIAGLMVASVPASAEGETASHTQKQAIIHDIPAGSTLAATGDAESKPPSPDYQGKPPFSANELWARVLKIVELPEGAITKEFVERVFAVKLKTEQPALSTSGQKTLHRYIARRGDNWYFDITVTDNGNGLMDFNFDFAGVPCIKADEITPSIEQSGWRLIGEERVQWPHNPGSSASSALPPKSPPLMFPDDRNIYRKGKIGALYLTFAHEAASCVLYISILTNPALDKMYPGAK